MSADTNSPKVRRRWLRRSLWALGVIGVLALLLLIAGRLAASSDFGRNFVEARLEAASVSGQKIEIDGLSGDLLGKLQIERLTIADANGVWLTAEDLQGDWAPLALRKKSLKIKELAAKRIDVLRRPELARAPSKSGSDTSPIRLADLKALRIETLRLHEGLTPREVDLFVEGRAYYAAGAGNVVMTVLPQGEVQDKIVADLSWSAENLLQGTADISGAAGGAITGLARLNPLDTLEAKIDASGDVGAWVATVSAKVNGEDALEAEAASRGELIDFKTVTQIRAHPLLADYAEWAGNTATVSGTVERTDSVTKLDVSAQSDRLLTSGLVSLLKSGDITADIIAEAGEPHLLLSTPGITLEQVSLDGVLARRDGALSYAGGVSATDIVQGSSRIERVSGPVTVSLVDNVAQFKINATGTRPVVSGAAGKYLGSKPQIATAGRYNLAGKTLSLSSSNVTLPALKASAEGSIGFGGERASADLSGVLNFDGGAAGLARPLKAQGSWSAVTGASDAIGVSFNGQVSGFGDVPDAVAARISDAANVRAKADIVPGGSINVRSLRVESGPTVLTGTGVRRADEELSADVSIMSGEIAPENAFPFPLTLDAKLSGRLSALGIDAIAKTPAAEIGGARIQDATLTFDGSYAGGKLDGQTSLIGETGTGPGALKSNIELQGSAWSLSAIDANWAGLTATGAASGDGGDLATVRADMKIDGGLPADMPADAVTADILISGQTVDIDGQLSGVSAGPLLESVVKINASGQPERVTFTVGVEGATELASLRRDLTATFAGEARDIFSQTRAVEGDLSAIMGKIGVETTQRIKFTQAPAGYELSGGLATLGGQVGFNVRNDPQRKLALDVSDIALGGVMGLAGRSPRDGTVSAKANLQATSLGGVEGDFTATVAGLRQLSGELSPLELSLKGDVVNDRLDLDIRTGGNSELNGAITASVPVKTNSATFMVMPMPNTGIDFKADINGDIGPVANVFAPAEMGIDGTVAANLEGTYPLSAGSVNGTFSLRDGAFEHGNAGLYLDRINLSGDITRERLRMSSFDARGRESGKLTGGGQMSLIGGASDLNIKVDKLLAVDRREVRGVVSGDLKLERRADLTSLTGALEMVDGRVNIDRLPRGREPTLNVSFETEDEEEEAAPKSKAATRLDVKVTSARGIKVVGLGVDAELGLNASVAGTFSDPEIRGIASIVRGRFDFIGKRFQFADSRIIIDGEPGAAKLDITARRKTNDLTAIVRVSGTANDPKVDLSSEPDLPEDEVLSRILFGRSPSQLTGLEAAQLAAAIAQLSGGGGFNLLGGIQDAVGLDTLAIDQSSSGSVQVTTGKYLADDVYLELRNGVTGSTGLAVEWTPLENIEVEAETTSDEGQSLSVQWTTDF